MRPVGVAPVKITVVAVHVAGHDLPPLRLHALTEDGVHSQDIGSTVFEPVTLAAGDYLIVATVDDD